MGQRILVKVLCESIVTIFNPQIRYKSDTFSLVRKKMSFLCMVFLEILDRQLFLLLVLRMVLSVLFQRKNNLLICLYSLIKSLSIAPLIR